MKKLNLLLFLVLWPFFSIAQNYYSGNVGDYISLPEPTLSGGYEIYASEFYSTSPHLDVYPGTNRVKILSAFNGYELAQCDYYCVRQYTVAGHIYEDYQNGTAYYYISCTGGGGGGGGNGGGTTPGTNPNDYDNDYGSWGIINIKIGESQTVYSKISAPNPNNLVSVIWSDYGQLGYVIESQNSASCTIRGSYTASNQKLWCLWKYGNSTYKNYYYVNVTEPQKETLSLTANTAGGTINKGGKVYLTPSVSGSDIYYTLNGQIPTSSSTKYTSSGITINESCTLKAFAKKSGYYDSPIMTWEFTAVDESTKIVKQISAGDNYSMVLMTDGSLWAFGYNKGGRFGDGTTKSTDKPIKVMDDVLTMSAGDGHSLIVKTDGSLWACGENHYGQLGDGTTTDRSTPVKIMNEVASVTVRWVSSLILKQNGSLWACGRNDSGQLGDGTNKNRNKPVKITDGVAAMATSGLHTLILKTNGKLSACGNNIFGMLGVGDTYSRYNPAYVTDDVAAIAAGSNHSLILKNNGTLWACGYNDCGQLCDGTTNSSYQNTQNTPKKVMTGISAIAANGAYSLILKDDKTLWACGDNEYGQLGTGTTTNVIKPVKVMDDVLTMSAGVGHCLILKTDGTLWACGKNTFGQLGDGTDIDRYTPVKIVDGDWTSIQSIQKDDKKRLNVYDLFGRRLTAPQKGINIINGKKYVVK